VPYLRPSSEPENICILRLSAIGDVTHVLPSLRAIQAHWPDCNITWIIGKTEAALVNDIPDVNFVLFDKKGGWKAYLQCWQQLRGKNFDILLHMQVSLRASLLSCLIKAKQRLGFDRKRAKNGQWLFTNQKIKAATNQHVLEGLLAFPEALGVSVDEKKLTWDIPIPESASTFADLHLPAGTPVLAVNPCTSNRMRNWRNWSAENYANVIDYAATTFGMNTVLTGGPDKLEVDFSRQIAALCEKTPINLVGRTSLKELYAVLNKASIMISPDTGPAHMAASAGTPVIGLYASSNPARTGPFSFLQLAINKYPEAIRQEYGKSVAEVPWGKRVRNPSAMELIGPGEVKAMLDRAMNSFAT